MTKRIISNLLFCKSLFCFKMSGKKNFFRRISNFRVFFRYIRESASLVRQGASFKDKLILIIYYLRIPGIIIKSLFTHKNFRELEEEKKFLRGNIVLKNKNGIFYCGNNIFTAYTANENYEKHLYPYIDIESGVFIDVGAHIGRYSIRLGKNANIKVIAIEPEKNNFLLLKKNIYLNNLTNITAINKGVYSSPGNIPFYLADSGEGTHSVFMQTDKLTETSIPVDTLDNMVDKLNLHDRISKVKIDVEGAELEVLKGAKKILETSHPSLVIEIWQKNKETLKRIIDMLEPYHYSVEQLDDDNYCFS